MAHRGRGRFAFRDQHRRAGAPRTRSPGVPWRRSQQAVQRPASQAHERRDTGAHNGPQPQSAATTAHPATIPRQPGSDMRFHRGPLPTLEKPAVRRHASGSRPSRVACCPVAGRRACASSQPTRPTPHSAQQEQQHGGAEREPERVCGVGLRIARTRPAAQRDGCIVSARPRQVRESPRPGSDPMPPSSRAAASRSPPHKPSGRSRTINGRCL